MPEKKEVSHETIVEYMEDLMRNWAYVHIYLTRPIADKYGKKGETIVRKGLRNFGAFRGKEIRKWHTSEGLPITMENLIRFWDAASAYVIMDEIGKDGLLTPYNVKFPVRTCTFNKTCTEEGYVDRGYWYCDEIHQEVITAYNKDAICEIHENLFKGDEFCGFHWMQVPAGPVDNSAAEAMAKRISKEKYAVDCLKRTTRVVGMLYIFLAKSIVEHLGDDGRKILTDAVTTLGQKRGDNLKQKFKASGNSLTVENILKNFDLPYNLLWRIESAQSNGKYTATVEHCPFAELWGQVELDDIGSIYCNNIYKSLFKVFNSNADIKIPECMTKGSKYCKFEFKL